MTTVKLFKSENTKQFSCSSWEQLHSEVSQWMHNEPFLLVNDSEPWVSLPTSGPVSNLPSHLTVIQLHDKISNVSSDNPTSSPFGTGHDLFSTLTHFLDQPESKVEYFLGNSSYKQLLQQDMHQFLTTFPSTTNETYSPPTQKLEKIIQKLHFLLTRETEHDVLYHQWVLDIMSMGSQLPPQVSTQIKQLSHIVFDTILYPS